MARIGQGQDALRRRNTGDYRIAGAWSVRLQPHGYHRDHFHPEGWLSSAFYVETPEKETSAGYTLALESGEKQQRIGPLQLARVVGKWVVWNPF